MHVYFMTRGVQQQMDIWKMFMQAQMWKFKRKNLTTGKDETTLVQGGLRPIQLWEYILPEEELPEFLTMMQWDKKTGVGWGLGQAKITALRKMISSNIEPIPEYEKIKSNRYVEQRGIAFYPLGIKKDVRKEMKEWGYEQEML